MPLVTPFGMLINLLLDFVLFKENGLTSQKRKSRVPKMPEACTVVSLPVSSGLVPASLCAPIAGNTQLTC